MLFRAVKFLRPRVIASFADFFRTALHVEDFIRRLYRESLLSIEEFRGLQEKISKLTNGEIQPEETLVRRALVTVDES